MNSIFLKLYCDYLRLKQRAKDKFDKMAKEENGMQTVEVIILVAVAVIIAAFLLNLLTKEAFEVDGKKMGLIEYFFTQIKNTFDGMFNSGGSDST